MKKILLLSAVLYCIPISAQTRNCDSLNRVLIQVNDTLRARLTIANDKILMIEKYMKIVNKKPSQSKYLKGWINRALRDDKR